MVRSLFTSRVARLATAPAGAATLITTTSYILGEKSVSTASNRVAQSTIQQAMQLQQRRAFTDPVKLAGEASANRFKSTTTVANVQKTAEPQSFVQWYEKHLQASPVKTKMVTGGLLWSLGDAVAQGVPAMMQTEGPDNGPFEYDIMRTGRAAFYGFAIHAPLSHLHFNFLEYLTIRVGVKGLGITIFKTFMEQVRSHHFHQVESERFNLMSANLTMRRPHLCCFISLFTGAGFQIHCIMVPWEPCKDSLPRKLSIELRMFFGIHKRLSGSFGFLFNSSTSDLYQSGTT